MLLAHPIRLVTALACLLALALLATACDSGSSAGAKGGVTIEPLVSATAGPAPLFGGKPAAPAATATAGDQGANATEVPSNAPAEPTQAAATQAPASLASDGSAAPTEGRWIDVDVTNFSVRLMDGNTPTREIAPVAVGEQVDTGAYASTQTGLFHVNSKVEALAYDAPYDTYISHWVGFDIDKANGFHSFLKDAKGTVVDARTGRISNGCIRTGEPDVVFAFAEIGMPVWVHH